MVFIILILGWQKIVLAFVLATQSFTLIIFLAIVWCQQIFGLDFYVLALSSLIFALGLAFLALDFFYTFELWFVNNSCTDREYKYAYCFSEQQDTTRPHPGLNEKWHVVHN